MSQIACRIASRCNLKMLALVLGALGFCRAQSPPPVPANFQDLYTQEQNYLANFNATLSSTWNGSTYPVLQAGALSSANGNAGPRVLGANYLMGVSLEVQGLKAMGFKAIMIELGFPMLYEPFFSSQTEFQQYVNFYTQVASIVRAAGMKLIIENTALWSSGIYQGWNTAPFYATLNWTQYQQARAQTAQVIAKTLQPDYMVLLEEPSTETQNSGQTQVDTPAGASSMVSQELTAVLQAGVPGMQIGAGLGTWDSQYQAITQALVALPLNFIDMHIYPINGPDLSNALSIINIAHGAGLPVAMTETWLYKIRDSELTTMNWNQIMSRDPFDFWQPLDTYFFQTMQNLGNAQQFLFISPFESPIYRANMPYNSTTAALTPNQMENQESLLAGAAWKSAAFAATGVSFHNIMVSPPDTTPPSSPPNLKGVSPNPTTGGLTWSASTDDVGVAGYYVSRNGVQLATTAGMSYKDTTLTGGTTYSYAVTAFDLAGNLSIPSTVSITTKDVIPPAAPTNLVATVNNSKEITLTWSPATDDTYIVAYQVYRGTSPTALTQVSQTYPTSQKFSSYPLTPGTTYYFAVTAEDSGGLFSPMSAVVSATTP